MPNALLAQLSRHTLVLLGIFIAPSHSTVWPGHELYPLDQLDGTDGFRVTSESSAGMLGFSVAGAGVSVLVEPQFRDVSHNNYVI